jgi:maltooligosyltrehalose trehalohydrolase
LLYQDLLRLRRSDSVFSSQAKGSVDGAVLGPACLLLRFFGEMSDDRLLVVNLGADLALDPAAQPLAAPPAGARWELLWSSEAPKYGGAGEVQLLQPDQIWIVPGHAAVVFAPRSVSEVGVA